MCSKHTEVELVYPRPLSLLSPCFQRPVQEPPVKPVSWPLLAAAPSSSAVPEQCALPVKATATSFGGLVASASREPAPRRFAHRIIPIPQLSDPYNTKPTI